MYEILRFRVVACEVTSCISLAEQKPEYALTNYGVDTWAVAIRKVRSKLYSHLGCRMLHIKVLCQFQAITQASQLHRKWAVTINTSVRAPNQFLLGAAIVHGKGIQIHRGVTTRQYAEIYWLAIDAAVQHKRVNLWRQIEPDGRMGVHALAQGWTGWNQSQTERTHEEGVAPESIDGIEVALTQAQRSQIGFEDVTVGRTRADGELRINKGIDFDVLAVFADKSQSGVGAKVIGLFLIMKSVMFWFTCVMNPTCDISRSLQWKY